MKVAVLGAGNAGSASAADLALRGHEVTIIKTSKSMHDDHFNYLVELAGAISLEENGEMRETKIQHVTRDLAAIQDAEVLIIYIQSTYHEPLLKRLLPLVQEDQIILFNPGYISSAYVLKHSAGKKLTVVEATSSFIDGRITEPGKVKVSFRNVRNPLGIYPKERTEMVQAKLDRLGFPFVYMDSVIEAGLHNPNLIVHTIGAIMSIPRIEREKENYDMYGEVFTPSVWNIVDKLDAEKMAVLAHLGYERKPYVEMSKLRNTLDESIAAKDAFFQYASRPTRVKGPFEVDSRYISEDVPQGLVMLESLGAHFDIPTPVCTGLIEIASAALGRDLRQGGRTVESLGKENIQLIQENARRQNVS